jgi:hypothetical protein
MSSNKSLRAYTTVEYLLDPLKFYHPTPRFMESDMASGNAVSLYAGNMVNLESDLTGRTRAHTKCSAGQYLPGTIVQSVDAGYKPKMVHLLPSAMPFDPLPKGYRQSPAPSGQSFVTLIQTGKPAKPWSTHTGQKYAAL